MPKAKKDKNFCRWCLRHNKRVIYFRGHLCPFYHCICPKCKNFWKPKETGQNQLREGSYCVFCLHHGSCIIFNRQHKMKCRYACCNCLQCTNARGPIFCGFCKIHNLEKYDKGLHSKHCWYRNSCQCRPCEEKRKKESGRVIFANTSKDSKLLDGNVNKYAADKGEHFKQHERLPEENVSNAPDEEDDDIMIVLDEVGKADNCSPIVVDESLLTDEATAFSTRTTKPSGAPPSTKTATSKSSAANAPLAVPTAKSSTAAFAVSAQTVKPSIALAQTSTSLSSTVTASSSTVRFSLNCSVSDVKTAPPPSDCAGVPDVEFCPFCKNHNWSFRLTEAHRRLNCLYKYDNCDKCREERRMAKRKRLAGSAVGVGKSTSFIPAVKVADAVVVPPTPFASQSGTETVADAVVVSPTPYASQSGAESVALSTSVTYEKKTIVAESNTSETTVSEPITLDCPKSSTGVPTPAAPASSPTVQKGMETSASALASTTTLSEISKSAGPQTQCCESTSTHSAMTQSDAESEAIDENHVLSMQTPSSVELTIVDTDATPVKVCHVKESVCVVAVSGVTNSTCKTAPNDSDPNSARVTTQESPASTVKVIEPNTADVAGTPEPATPSVLEGDESQIVAAAAISVSSKTTWEESNKLAVDAPVPNTKTPNLAKTKIVGVDEAVESFITMEDAKFKLVKVISTVETLTTNQTVVESTASSFSATPEPSILTPNLIESKDTGANSFLSTTKTFEDVESKTQTVATTHSNILEDKRSTTTGLHGTSCPSTTTLKVTESVTINSTESSPSATTLEITESSSTSAPLIPKQSTTTGFAPTCTSFATIVIDVNSTTASAFVSHAPSKNTLKDTETRSTSGETEVTGPTSMVDVEPKNVITAATYAANVVAAAPNTAPTEVVDGTSASAQCRSDLKNAECVSAPVDTSALPTICSEYVNTVSEDDGTFVLNAPFDNFKNDSTFKDSVVAFTPELSLAIQKDADMVAAATPELSMTAQADTESITSVSDKALVSLTKSLDLHALKTSSACVTPEPSTIQEKNDPKTCAAGGTLASPATSLNTTVLKAPSICASEILIETEKDFHAKNTDACTAPSSPVTLTASELETPVSVSTFATHLTTIENEHSNTEAVLTQIESCAILRNSECNLTGVTIAQPTDMVDVEDEASSLITTGSVVKASADGEVITLSMASPKYSSGSEKEVAEVASTSLTITKQLKLNVHEVPNSSLSTAEAPVKSITLSKYAANSLSMLKLNSAQSNTTLASSSRTSSTDVEIETSVSSPIRCPSPIKSTTSICVLASDSTSIEETSASRLPLEDAVKDIIDVPGSHHASLSNDARSPECSNFSVTCETGCESSSEVTLSLSCDISMNSTNSLPPAAICPKTDARIDVKKPCAVVAPKPRLLSALRKSRHKNCSRSLGDRSNGESLLNVCEASVKETESTPHLCCVTEEPQEQGLDDISLKDSVASQPGTVDMVQILSTDKRVHTGNASPPSSLSDTLHSNGDELKLVDGESTRESGKQTDSGTDICQSLLADLANFGSNVTKAVPFLRSVTCDEQSKIGSVDLVQKALPRRSNSVTFPTEKTVHCLIFGSRKDSSSPIERLEDSFSVERVSRPQLQTGDRCPTPSNGSPLSSTKSVTDTISVEGEAGFRHLEIENACLLGRETGESTENACASSKSDCDSSNNCSVTAVEQNPGGETGSVAQISGKVMGTGTDSDKIHVNSLDCSFCSKKNFPTRSQLRLHGYLRHRVDTESSVLDSYQCELCSYIGSNEISLLDHQTIHMDLVPLNRLLYLATATKTAFQARALNK